LIDRFRGLGTVYRETEVERADLETIIADLMSVQFNDPVPRRKIGTYDGSFHVDCPSSFSATMRSPIIIRASVAVVWSKPFAHSHVSAAARAAGRSGASNS
jgi:hypothetical protein